MGTAQLMDGGTQVIDSEMTQGFDDDRMTFTATDISMGPGSAALVTGAGASRIIEESPERLRFSVDLSVGYFPSGFPGGDNPGGSAEGEISSVFEFVLPVDDPEWAYRPIIDSQFPFPFTGDSRVTVENVTRSTVLINVSEDTDGSILGTLDGSAGDLIRVTTEIMGKGSMGPGSRKDYFSQIDVNVLVPEPATASLVILAMLGAAARRRRACDK